MSTRSARPRALIASVVALVVAAVALLVLGLWRPWSPLPDAGPVGAAEQGVAAPAPLDLPQHPLVLVFGDSWTYGSAATDITDGYAYVLGDLIGGRTIVDGVRGSGYLKEGIDGPDYGTRIAALDAGISPDLVILQGSINDRLLVPGEYDAAVASAWDDMAARFPDARIVVLGPAPHEFPVAAGTRWIDRELSALAAARGWWYVSPIAEEWITEDSYLDIIDVDAGRKHPSTAGHRHLAERLAAALAAAGMHLPGDTADAESASTPAG